MGRKSKLSYEQKKYACESYLSGIKSMSHISNELNIDEAHLRKIICKYKVHGDNALIESSKNNAYAKAFKENVVNEYVQGKGSFVYLASKYNISQSMIFKWVELYYNGVEQKDYYPKSEVYTMANRKVTLEEKLKIINHCIDNNDYKGAADKFDVPYHSVFKWVKTYREFGEDSLKDKRGRPTNKSKETKELTETEKLKLELEASHARVARLERALNTLKKKEEIHQRRLKQSFQKFN